MNKTILEIYALSVCFFTVACFVITLGLVTWNVVELNSPEFTISNTQYECHQTDSEFKKCLSQQFEYKREDKPEKLPAGNKLTEKRISEYKQIINAEQRQALQGIAQKLIILLIGLLLFLAHWVLAKRAR